MIQFSMQAKLLLTLQIVLYCYVQSTQMILVCLKSEIMFGALSDC